MCPFCNPQNIIIQTPLAYAILDKYLVSPGHMLIITKRHVADFFDTTVDERQAVNDLLEQAKAWLEQEYKPDGYNIGVISLTGRKKSAT